MHTTCVRKGEATPVTVRNSDCITQKNLTDKPESKCKISKNF